MAQSPPSLEEPKTPMWLPAVGVLLFLGVGIWWATRPPEAPPPAPDSGVVEVAEAGAEAAPAATIAPTRPQH